MPAPIALFAYCRPDHLARTLAALRANPEAAASQLYVYADAARNVAAQPGVDGVRALLKGVSGFAGVELRVRDENFGLARNITGGVTEVLARHDRVIVVEDDVMAGPHFLRFMNDALELYRDDQRVGSVSGYTYPSRRPLPETFFLKGADCWGWATWRDRWTLYNPDGQALLNELTSRNLTRAFDFDGNMAYTRMLRDQIAGKNDSWAVRWHASCFLKDRLILYPARAQVQNIGNDGSGTHVKAADTTFDVELNAAPVRVGGIAVEESVVGREAFCDFFRSMNGSEPPSSLAGKARAVVGGIVRRLRGRVA